MTNRYLRKYIITAIVLTLTVFCLSMSSYANISAIEASYGKLPIAFEANEGQVDPNVKYIAKGQGYTLFLTAQEFVLIMSNDKIKTAAVQIKFVNPDAKTITGADKLSGSSNYFIGNDPEKWRTNVPAYEKVRYEDIYHGIDLVVYGNQKQIEYDFVVAPHADYKQIAFQVNGANRLSIDKDGNLIIASKGGSKMLMHKPLVYQETDGVRQEIEGRYAVSKGNLVSFNVAGYDKTKALVIDPTLAYSTYLGGSNSRYGDYGYAIKVDSSGNAYVVGYTYSTDFPTTTGAFQTSLKASPTAFITKLNSTGTALVYSTYLGGSGGSSYGDTGNGIAVDSSGNAYITGTAYSTDFPTTTGAYQTTLKGSNNPFVTKLNSTGNALVYSTLVGGTNTNLGDSSYGIAVDSSGNAYITGTTASRDFPVTTGAFQTTLKSSSGNAFITKLNSTGSALVYSTYLGGSSYGDYGFSIAIDSSGSAYVTGLTWSTDFPVTAGAFQTTQAGSKSCPFVTKLNAGGTALVYSTFLGGTYGGYGTGIAVDSSGYAYVSGTDFSSDFPTTTGAFQTTLKGRSNAFISKLNTSGTALVYSTLLGGSTYANYSDTGNGIAIDSSGNAYVTGYTSSTDFPTTTGAYQTTLNGAVDVYITKLNSTGTALVYSTLLGGSSNGDHSDTGTGIAVDSSGDTYVIGNTSSTDFPTTTGAFQTTLKGAYNTFITKLSLSSPVYYYTLTVSKSGSGTITSSPSGISCGATCSSTYTSGTSVTLTATADYGYAFSGWSGCDSTSSDHYQCTVNMSSAKTVTATFTSSSTTYALTASKSGTGTGAITSSPSGLSCGSQYTSCSWSYTSGTWVTLTAAPDNNSTFSGWSGCDSTSGSQCTVTMSAAKSVTAAFTLSTPNTFVLTVTEAGTGAGTVTASSGTLSWSGSTGTASYTSGTSVTLTATASSGSAFTSWTGCDSTSGSQCTVAMSAAKGVTATFTSSTPNTYALTVTKSGTGSGTVTASSGTLSWSGSAGTASYTSGTSVTLTATASSGSAFSSWTGCDSTSGSQCTVTMSAAKRVTATFGTPSSVTRTLTISKSFKGTGTITSSPSGISCGTTCTASYTSGTAVTLTEAAGTGSTFSSWTGCDSTSGSQCTITMSSDKTVSAAFSLDNDTAAAAITAVYNGYAWFFGTASGTLGSGSSSSGTYYYQWFTNGAALLAAADGYVYTYYNGTFYPLNMQWGQLGMAYTGITAIYNQYASWFGSTSGLVQSGTSSSGTYYLQWYSNGAALVAWTDGNLYTYYNGTSYPLNTRWK